ncbi:MAG TPA: Ppx/GppA phosphatase family protein [Candidatus Binatia bacterium]|nr:Ppx/GppA phosphatase family protein [Candidatus Binatia bacterium]
MRLAAVDVGSNSVHMVIADVGPDGRIQVVDRVKEMVRLGRRTFTTGRLPEDAMDLAVRAVGTFARLARARQVERLRAVATSAVREARNGAAFVRRLRRETGIPVRVVSGVEEAALIFRAARHALGLEGGPYLLVDVGGGSVELVLVQDGRALWMRSLPLGVARLTERLLGSDRPGRRQVRQLEKHLDRELGELLARVRHAGVVSAIGTSGTVNTLVAMAAAARGAEFGRLHGVRVTAGEIRRLRRRLLAVGSARRAALPAMDAKRADLMPAAAVLVDFVLARAGAPELVACTWALREGLLLEVARAGAARRGREGGARRRSVEALAARFAGENAHGRHVARLALQVFDATAPALRLPPASRELLEYAALLHDIGHAVEHDRHHRHGCYLVRSAELLGFDRLEIEMLAQVVRGHRKQPPKPSDPELAALPPRARRVVRGLAAILRLADGLDRTRFGVVKALSFTQTAGRLTIEVDSGGEDAELELWAAERRVELLARLLERPIVLRAVHSPRPRQAVARAAISS